MVHSRNKGARGEREVMDALNKVIEEIVGENAKFFSFVQRNAQQFASGGSDLINTLDFEIEVKFCETLNLNAWWEQVTTNATKTGKEPVLVYRQSRKPWRVRMYGTPIIAMKKGIEHELTEPAEFDFETFLAIFRQVFEKSLTS